MNHTEVVIGLTDTVRAVLDHKELASAPLGRTHRFTKPWKSWRIKTLARC